MNLTEFFIRRPAFTIVITLVLSIVGILCYQHLPVRWIPNINPPIVSIYTTYPGANANLVESQITTPIEGALAGIDGVDTISSNSKQNDSFITLTFKLGHNIDTAVEDVRSALQRIGDGLPNGVKPPSVEKANPNGMPILFLAFSNSRATPEELSDYVKQFIIPRIQTVEGVSSVTTFGERESAMRIWLDPMKMAALNVTVDDISKALIEQNTSVPSGQIRSASRFYSVVTDTTLNSANEFNDMIIRDDQNQPVHLKDVGSAIVAAANTDTAFRVNGQPAIAIGIIPQSNANPLSVSKQVMKQFKEIQKGLPLGMQGSIVFDQASFIQASVDHVYQTLTEATLLVLLVILLFLASWRAALIPIVTIPVCLISVFAVLYMLGYSINIITLMALVLAIGLVVDDAIVMLENIMRHIEQGMSTFAAAIKGSREIIFSIIAMTLTLAAVYAPIFFTPGLLGSVFKEFAATLAGAVLISGFVALTLSPMMCARLLSHSDKNHPYQLWITEKFLQLQAYYHHLLMHIFTRKNRIVLALLAIGMSGIVIFHFIPSELAPAEDMNEVDVYVAAPRNASFQFTDNYVRQLESAYQQNPEVTSYLSQTGEWSPSKSFQILTLKPLEKRHMNAASVAEKLDQQFASISGVRVNVSAPPSPLSWVTDSDGRSIEMEIMSSNDYKNLHAVTQDFLTKVQKNPAFQHVDSRLKWDGEQFQVSINKEKAADTKVSIGSISNTISVLMAGRNAGHFDYNGKQYDITMQMNQANLADPNIISQLYARNSENKMVPLSDLVSMHETTSPEMLPHYERLRADSVYADIAPGYTIADAVSVLQKMALKELPDNVKFDFVGEAHNYLETSSAMSMTFLLALVFIYLVLVAQFESFIDPFIILLTVPFALIGALLTLKMTGGSLNIYSNIALVTLIGLIAKHGILITDFANRLQKEGKTIHDAAVEAAKLRLRPILMTTAAMILGAAPLALSSGSGAETRHQIGWVIVGGLFIGTFFSLIVIPVAYTYLAQLKVRFKLL
jgi:multidrug efflux pump